jgi:UPF0755 protein
VIGGVFRDHSGSFSDTGAAAMLRWLTGVLWVALAVLIAAAGAGGWFYWKATSPLRLAAASVEFEVAPGSGMRAAARDIAAAGIEFEPWMLVALARLRRVEGSIKAGNYEAEAGITLLGLLDKLTRGDVTQTEVAFIEGWTFRQLRERLDAYPEIRHESLGLSGAEIMRRIGAEGAETASPEGWFFPDTYLFAKGSGDLDVLTRAHRVMRRHLEREWAAREQPSPLETPYQALILASMVEKETGREADRAQIAAVFLNRIRRGMLMQSDPTVIYGMGERFDGNLRRRDLTADTPYNTYTRAGLPPTPIAMPGLASLRAVLHPAPSEALYFVARGDGSSHFSRTLDEHNRAVNRYQRGR